jgi:signal-transduction protein with cAMP-binding, CBS, and nucleotidyltransferase domain/predicted metal-dependent phosphoesterase TrpH/PAS domain-containing protein
MSTMTRVDLHCHSSHSDGTLKPEAVADRLAADQVTIASLVDHDSLDGLNAFRKRLARHGIGFITGVEITCQYQGRAAHLLAYGFDPDHAELRANLDAIWLSHEAAAESIAGSLQRKRRHGPQSSAPLLPGAGSGRIELADGIALVHRAGGRAFLAHPLFLQPNPDKLEVLLPGLIALGLDGMEAIYPAFTPEDQARLIEMARRHQLLVCAGSDFHHSGTATGIDMPAALWKAFRDAVLTGAKGAFQPADDRPRLSSPHRLNFILRIVLPTVVAMLLFGIALLDVILPAIENSLLERKREMIRELVNSAWGILAEAEQEVANTVTPLDQAQMLAKKRIETLRYGREGKDYFWLQDLHPRILMHPYRPDLNGQDVSDFRDARGVRIFVEFANLVRRQNEGFVDYVWQWKDDPHRLVPKESYIRAFAPWGWIIGTGMYTEDVREEIARIERHLVRIAVGIAAIIALLLLYVIQQSLHLERKRREAEESLRDSTERYRALVEAATEGTLLAVEGRCRYANPTLLRRLGYDGSEIELLELADILPHLPGNARAWDALEELRSGVERPDSIEAVLRGRDNRLLDCLLAFSRISIAGRDGLIVQARDLAPRQPDGVSHTPVSGEPGHALAEAADNAPLGLFRARALRRGAVMEVNRAALEFLPALGAGNADAPPALAAAFPNPEAFDDFMRRLERDGLARHRLHRATPDGQGRTLTLDARLIPDEAGAPRFIDGCITDTSDDARRESERDSLIERLQTSLLYLHEPVERFLHPPAFCASDTPISEVASLMTAQDSEAALIRGENGVPIGMITDRLLRARVITGETPLDEPVRRVMRELIVTVPRRAQVYEALLLMQEKGVEHVAVEDDSGAIIGLVHSRDILHLHGSEAAMLTGRIAHAASAEEAIRWCHRAPMLVKALLDSGANARQVTRLVSAICDAATTRFIELAQREQGPAPCPFVFLALGSQGRQEMTLFADQDNALLFAPPDGSPAAETAPRYFLELGDRICGWLEQAGYPFCRGSIMAKNPKWCASLAEWERITTEWIHKAEPQQLLEFNIFLDFRHVAGQAELARQLRLHVLETLHAHPPFLPFLALDLMRFRPPPSRLIRWLYPPGKRARVALIELKEAMMPLIGFARLYALRYRLDETHTLDRLESLNRRNLISEADLRETAVAYDSLLRLRLLHQAECLQENRPLDNTIDWRRLDPVQKSLLQEAFTRIAAIQKKISYDFLGGN